ncbi:MAG: type II toxin-antitoxin system VapC family toxin [Chloroflexi bacterium]|nr:type II toxin-antitoxin system VapC family toxin [Chloroflexota bacterium]
MNMVVDTSVIIAVVTNEEHKPALIQLTEGMDLIAPAALHWEIGNTFSAMFKRNRIDLDQVRVALKAYRQIPLRLVDMDLEAALELASNLDIYAYDAYFIGCALRHNSALLTLDKGLAEAAQRAGVDIREEVLR